MKGAAVWPLPWKFHDPSASVAKTLLLDLGRTIGVERFVEARPALFGIGGATRGRVHPVGLAQNGLRFRIEAFLDPCGDERTAAPNAFGIDMGMLFGNPRLRHGADQAAGRTTGNRPCGGACRASAVSRERR